MSFASSAASAAAAAMRRYPFHGKTLVWTRLERFIEPGDVEVTFPGGARMAVNTRYFWQRQMMAGCFERAGAWVVPRLLADGETFIDGGANCGYYSVLAAARVGAAGRVIAFEPDARLHAQLQRQAALNGQVIRVETTALSDEAGQLTFHVNPAADPRGTSIGQGSLEARPGWTRVGVPVISLDEYIERQSLPPVRLAKLDLEGHERRALAGASRALASGAIENLLVEVNDRETAAMLRGMPWERMVIVGERWRDADPATLGRQQDDVLCLRGEGARRFAALRFKALV